MQDSFNIFKTLIIGPRSSQDFVVVIPHHTDVTMGGIAAYTLHKKNLCLNKILRVLFKEKYED